MDPYCTGIKSLGCFGVDYDQDAIKIYTPNTRKFDFNSPMGLCHILAQDIG